MNPVRSEPVSFLLIAALLGAKAIEPLAVEIMEAADVAEADGGVLRAWLRGNFEALLEGRIWTLVTAAFVHDSWFETLTASAFVLLVVRMLEQEIGSKSLLARLSIHVPLTTFIVSAVNAGWDSPAALIPLGAKGWLWAQAVSLAWLVGGRKVVMASLHVRFGWILITLAAIDVALVQTEPDLEAGRRILVTVPAAAGAWAGLATEVVRKRLRADRRPASRGATNVPLPAERAARDPSPHELDRVLEKISTGGLSSLSPAERQFLDQSSKHLRERSSPPG